MQRKILSVTPRPTAAEALGLMDDKNIRMLPVLDAERTMLRPALAVSS